MTKWICKIDGYECSTRKEMKEHINKVSFFKKLMNSGDIYYETNYIADYELQKNNGISTEIKAD